MEITPSHIAILNSRLPAGFKLEEVSEQELTPAAARKRRSETENLRFDMRFHQSSTRVQRVPNRPEFEALPARLRNSESFIRAYNIIQKLKAHDKISAFLTPIDAALFTDYYELVSEPIDLSTIEGKLMNGDYETMRQLADDVRKMWKNSFFYNPRDSELFNHTVDLSAYFETLIRDCENGSIGDRKTIGDLTRKMERVEQEIRDLRTNNNPLTLEEKRKLVTDIQSLDKPHLLGVYNIVKGAISGSTGKELEFDIESLPVEVSRRLENYVSQAVQETKGKKAEKPKESESSSSSSDSDEEDVESVEQKQQGVEEPDSIQQTTIADIWTSYRQSGYPDGQQGLFPQVPRSS